MTYWGTGQQYFSTEVLLTNGDGRCHAWAKFFTDALRTQGIDAQMIEFRAPAPPLNDFVTEFSQRFGVSPVDYYNGEPKAFMFVKNWTLGQNNFDPTDENGVEAQGKNNPASVFTNHLVVKFGTVYYDPSYGSDVRSSHQEWEDASLDAFGFGMVPKQGLNAPPLWIWKADTKGAVETTELIDGY